MATPFDTNMKTRQAAMAVLVHAHADNIAARLAAIELPASW